MKLYIYFFLILGLCTLLSCVGVTHPVVIIKTDLGEIEVEIYHDRAPVTTANFLRYVDAGLYKDGSFYRTVTPDNDTNPVDIEVIQGGTRWNSEVRGKGFPAIKHETTNVTKVIHLDGTISMARSEPGTASSEFFICIGDQPELDYEGSRNKDGKGFSAFGRVIKGMDVVRNIHRQPAEGQTLNPLVMILEVVRKE
ncbi:peptidylprolyl isomerase [candidate division KSB1 bacterium]